MKKLVYVLVSYLCCCLLLISCSLSKGCFHHYKSSESLEKNLWKSSYEKFDGFKYININLNKESGNYLNVKINDESGNLDLVIENSQNNIIYESLDMVTSSFEIPVEKCGKYKIKVKANNHKGGFHISWE